MPEGIENNASWMRVRSRIIGFGGAGLLVVAGVGGEIGFGGTVGQLLALVLVSLGLILATALVFYEVGLSEDRARAREEARDREAKKSEAKHPRRPLPRVPLERRRGQRRRLR